MNHMLPILSAAVWLSLTANMTFGQLPQSQTNKRLTKSSEISSGHRARTSPATEIDGQELVAQAAQRLLVVPGIEAKTRQRVNIFGQRLVGSGTYFQLTDRATMMLRLDLKLQVGDQVSSLQQISDGHFFWVRRDQGSKTDLSRVNLRRLREAARQYDSPPPPSLWMALGGLPKLLTTLEGHFKFSPPTPMVVGKSKLQVWRLEGVWKPEILANLLPDQRDAILAGKPARLDALPEHLPHGVTLILGRDRIIPLFPYSISYYRHEPVEENETRSDAARRQPMVTWELFEVRLRSDLSRDLFEYPPGDQEVEERTDDYIKRLNAAMKARSANK